MSWRSTLTVAVVVGAMAFTAGRVWSQDGKDAGPKMPTDDEMKKMMAEMAAPAEEHKKLAAMAGTWDCEMTMYEPGKEPKKEKGVSTSRSVLNGLYVASEHKSTMDGMPFEGMEVDGYSKEKKKYFTFWIDQMGTTPMLLWGTPDAAGKVITYDADAYDCGPMGQMTPRTRVIHEDADHFTFEFWAKFAGAPDYMKMMEGKYTRRK
jgi:hypothetical protein